MESPCKRHIRKLGRQDKTPKLSNLPLWRPTLMWPKYGGPNDNYRDRRVQILIPLPDFREYFILSWGRATASVFYLRTILYRYWGIVGKYFETRAKGVFQLLFVLWKLLTDRLHYKHSLHGPQLFDLISLILFYWVVGDAILLSGNASAPHIPRAPNVSCVYTNIPNERVASSSPRLWLFNLRRFGSMRKGRLFVPRLAALLL